MVGSLPVVGTLTLSVRDRQWYDVARHLGLGLRRRHLLLCARGEHLPVGGLGVALDLLQRRMAGHRHDLVRGAVALGHDAAACLAQTMRYAVLRQARFVAARAEPGVEALLAEWAAPFVGKERE